MTETLEKSAEQSGMPVFARSGYKVTVRLNRPKQHNRIEPADLEALQKMLQSIEADEGIRVLILTGSGKSFSSGYHLGDLKSAQPAAGRSRPRESAGEPTLFARVVDQLEHLRIPTICALNGSVYGGATDLALACDFRIGITGIKMRMPAAKLGLQYYAGGMRRYVQRLGLNAAKKLFLTAATIEAGEMLRIGYLDEIVEPQELMPRANALADVLTANAPLVICEMKRFLNQIARGEADSSAIDAAHKASITTADAKEGIAAWFERRKPNFRGR
jgi:enoyl-CoA hydratase/carnithine racemase